MIGGAGYIGGELVRLLVGHPRAELVAVTSRSQRDKPVSSLHPNLRGRTGLRFVGEEDLPEVDVVFLAMPHRETMGRMREFLAMAPTVIDLSGDFRLTDLAAYERYYGVAHAAPELVGEFVPGIPEYHRERLRTADRISVPGCMANAGVLTLAPLARGGLIDGEITLDARTGSSGAGANAGSENLHAERSGTLRVFAPTRHRHEAEIAQATGHPVRMTATGVEAVRGVQIVARVRMAPGTSEKEVWAAYRDAYRDEPFVRVVAARRGIHRFPDAKILAGSNYCDVGFALEEDMANGTVIGALDNLVKGGAGNAVQCLNIRRGWDEADGLEFPGLHPN
ncbi:N-acetyl-gamma-glutamyl-phosphate reductase [Myceligenerans cantabricum]